MNFTFRRCSKDAETQRRLKGRNSLMLLIILNLALYLLETVNVSSKTNQKVSIYILCRQNGSGRFGGVAGFFVFAAWLLIFYFRLGTG